MIAKLSPLQLIDFQLLNLHYQFVNPSEEDEIETDELFGTYGIEVDFAIKRHDDSHFSIFTKADINAKATQPGYVLFAEGVSSFQLAEPSTLPEAKLQNLLVYSGVGIAMQQLRSRVADLTSFAPFGKYMLPTLDIDDLLKQKREKNERIEKSEQKSLVNKNDKLITSTKPGKAAFRKTLLQKLHEADFQGKPFLDVRAGDLHKEVVGVNDTDNRMPSCSDVMKEVMKPGDEVLKDTPKGKGANVTVRYKLPR